MPIVAMHTLAQFRVDWASFLCLYEKKNAEMVAHTISAAFVVNATTEVSIKSSDFVVEVYMCFFIYCFSRGSISATNSVVIVWFLCGNSVVRAGKLKHERRDGGFCLQVAHRKPIDMPH